MKRVVTLILVLAMALTSCNKQKDSDKVKINKLKAEVVNLKMQMQADSADCIAALDTLMGTVNEVDVCTKKHYYIVVGSFRETWRAEKWLNIVEELGYTCCIVQTHNDWNCVYVKAGNDFKVALNILENVRERVTLRAWIYVSREEI